MRFLILQCLCLAVLQIDSAPHYLTYSPYLPAYQPQFLTPFLSTSSSFINHQTLPVPKENKNDHKDDTKADKETIELEEESVNVVAEEPEAHEEKESTTPSINTAVENTIPGLVPNFYTPVTINFGPGFQYVPFPIPGVPWSFAQSNAEAKSIEEENKNSTETNAQEDVKPTLMNPFQNVHLPVLPPFFKNFNSTILNGTQTVVSYNSTVIHSVVPAGDIGGVIPTAPTVANKEQDKKDTDMEEDVATEAKPSTASLRSVNNFSYQTTFPGGFISHTFKINPSVSAPEFKTALPNVPAVPRISPRILYSTNHIAHPINMFLF